MSHSPSIPDPNDPVERGHRRLMAALMPGAERLTAPERVSSTQAPPLASGAIS